MSSNLHFRQNSCILLSDLSDHMPCLSVIKNVLKGNKVQTKIKKRNLSEKKIEEIVQELEGTNFDQSLLIEDVNQSMESFHTQIRTCMDKISPEREITVSTNQTRCEPWMTKGLRKCAKKQLTLYKRWLIE